MPKLTSATNRTLKLGLAMAATLAAVDSQTWAGRPSAYDRPLSASVMRDVAASEPAPTATPSPVPAPAITPAPAVAAPQTKTAAPPLQATVPTLATAPAAPLKLAPQATSKVTPIDLAGFNLSTIVQRDVTLAELGFARTIVMGGLDTQREFYLPVPPLAPIQNAALKLDANYLRSDGGKTALILLLDNDPISSRSMTADKGDASLVVPIDGRVRTSNSVLLSVIWKSIQGEENTCTDGRSTGNFLSI